VVYPSATPAQYATYGITRKVKAEYWSLAQRYRGAGPTAGERVREHRWRRNPRSSRRGRCATPIEFVDGCKQTIADGAIHRRAAPWDPSAHRSASERRHALSVLNYWLRLGGRTRVRNALTRGDGSERDSSAV
jgi:hypothetical protein